MDHSKSFGTDQESFYDNEEALDVIVPLMVVPDVRILTVMRALLMIQSFASAYAAALFLKLMSVRLI